MTRTTSDTVPHSNLKDGRQLAYTRLKRQMGGSVSDEVVRKLCRQTFLQSNANSQYVLRRDTGERIVTATPIEVEQSIIGRRMQKKTWAYDLLAIPHPVYAPIRHDT